MNTIKTANFVIISIALVDMMIVAVLQPLGFVGKSIGAFFDNVLGKVYWCTFPPLSVCDKTILFVFI